MKKFANKQVNKLKKYQKKKFDYYKMINDYYLVNNEAYISAKITTINDIVSKYSINKDEILNDEFVRFVNTNASYIPDNYSLVLEICNHQFSEDEKNIITKVIQNHYELELIKAEDELKTLRRKEISFLLVGILFFIIFILIYHFKFSLASEEILSFVASFSIWEFAEMRIFEEDEIKEKIVEITKLNNMKIKFNELST